MVNPGFTYSLPALRVLENEHRFLTHEMSQWHAIVLDFENGRYNREEGLKALQQLRKLIVEFIEPLKNHTEKEEEFLFPMLAKYVGNDQGPVQAVQEEHDEIDAYIGHFLHHTRGDLSAFTLEMMQDVVKDAGEAFEVIMIHFVKEENVIFPMVMSVLRAKEQDELFDQLYTSIVPES
ncbi:cation-binding protein [Sporosarcina sp. P37]|uniref:hemerythrin domain-containing protein n=1 Tax=unclassified Sporosarcina TaxID=2647733 RepID=UPI0009C00D95|nr:MULTISPECIES: hemerythrin domain-containing protein [unclassified Sporosarcina]ARD48684.1 cation-binding protein [Sporosarcina sp. P33]ARK25190.1 cation-binding protein [Sporosarcina sp. P37]PID17493.1 cation-binding protein [Sporosarcina sp. P35]